MRRGSVSAETIATLAVFVSSDSKTVLFSTTVAVDGVDHVVNVLDGDDPVNVARNFAVKHKLDLKAAQSVLMHLKQRALVGGHMKRVFFTLPVEAHKSDTKQVCGPLRRCAAAGRRRPERWISSLSPGVGPHDLRGH
jgi:hypothetical protein